VDFELARDQTVGGYFILMDSQNQNNSQSRCQNESRCRRPVAVLVPATRGVTLKEISLATKAVACALDPALALCYSRSTRLEISNCPFENREQDSR
jgi:hypothetical protein